MLLTFDSHSFTQSLGHQAAALSTKEKALVVKAQVGYSHHPSSSRVQVRARKPEHAMKLMPVIAVGWAGLPGPDECFIPITSALQGLKPELPCVSAAE